jgi:hypothetical protein
MLPANTMAYDRQWAKEPDLGVKSFANSILSTSRSICIPYQGVLLYRASYLRDGFVFRAESCSGNCSNGKWCSHCASKIYVCNKVRESVQAIVECAGKQAGKQATITNILSNPVLAAMEIRMAREVIRSLHCELARVVLFDAMEKDGAIFQEGTEGDQIRKVVEIMNGPISKVLQLGVATVELELWHVHAEHIKKVCGDGGKRRGCQTYHPMIMNWAIAFLAHTSSSTYNEVAKIMMLPNISTVYWKTAKIITSKNNKAYAMHMNTICSISDRARLENWTSHLRIGVIAQSRFRQHQLWNRA